MALGEGYAVSQELPAVWGSRYFTASERGTGREVTIRVLPTEVASAVDVARFRTLMAAVANLAHPHLLPMLAAGNAPGMLFYLVPRLPGETLRQRLDRDFRTSVPEAARIIAELGDALRYAHRQKVMHGDIRPELVMLTATGALLADVGIAAATRPPASASARSPDTGTAAAGGYLSPEQLSDPASVDARSDVYSLGILAYEILAGERPYPSDAHAVSSGPLVAAPPRLAAVRRDIPRPLSEVVAKAMTRDRAQRYRDPQEFAAAMRRAARATSVRTRRALFAGGGVLALAAIVATVMQVSRRSGIDDNVIAVAPFAVPEGDRDVWREGMVDVLSANLDASGALRTVPASVSVRGWTAAGDADHQSASEFARRVGARLVIYGRVVPAGHDSVRTTAFVVDALEGRARVYFEFMEAAGRMDRVADSLTVHVMRGLHDREFGATTSRRGSPPQRYRTTSFGSQSLPAVSSFLRGERFVRTGAYDSARVAYRRAIALDPEFVVAMSRLWRLASRAGVPRDVDYQESEAAGRRSMGLNHGLAPIESIAVLRDSLVFEMIDAPSQGTLDRLKAVVNVAVLAHPQAPEIWMMAAEERSGSLQHLGATNVDVLQASERAIGLDSAFAAPYLTAFNSAWEAYGWPSAIVYLDALERTNPRSLEARGLSLLRRVHDARLADDSAMRVDSVPSDVITVAMSYATMVHDSANTAMRLARIRMRQRQPLESQERAIIAATLLSRGHWREARAVGGVAAVAHELPLAPGFSSDSVVAWSEAWAAQARAGVVPFRPHALLWRSAEMGRVDLLRTIERGAESIARTTATRESKYVVELARALMPLATARDTTAALHDLQRIGESLCFLGCYPIRVGIARSLNNRGEMASASTLLGNGDGAFSGLRFWALPLTRTLWRLERARASEAAREVGQAVLDYTAVLTILKDADPELQRINENARAGLKRMGQ